MAAIPHPVTIAALVVATLAGCASARPPGTFAEGGPLHANTLRLNADGTFSYEAWADDSGLFWRAEGTWTWLGPDRLATQIASVTLGSQRDSAPLQRYQVWRVTRRGVVHDTALFERRRG